MAPCNIFLNGLFTDASKHCPAYLITLPGGVSSFPTAQTLDGVLSGEWDRVWRLQSPGQGSSPQRSCCATNSKKARTNDCSDLPSLEYSGSRIVSLPLWFLYLCVLLTKVILSENYSPEWSCYYSKVHKKEQDTGKLPSELWACRLLSLLNIRTLRKDFGLVNEGWYFYQLYSFTF